MSPQVALGAGIRDFQNSTKLDGRAARFLSARDDVQPGDLCFGRFSRRARSKRGHGKEFGARRSFSEAIGGRGVGLESPVDEKRGLIGWARHEARLTAVVVFPTPLLVSTAMIRARFPRATKKFSKGRTRKQEFQRGTYCGRGLCRARANVSRANVGVGVRGGGGVYVELSVVGLGRSSTQFNDVHKFAATCGDVTRGTFRPLD